MSIQELRNRLALSLMSSLGAHSVRIAAIGIRPGNEALWLDLNLTGGDHDRSSAFFDLSGSPLVLARHQSETAEVNYYTMGKRPHVLHVRLRRGFTWADVKVSLQFRWPNGRKLVVIPDWAPTPVGCLSEDVFTTPELRLAFEGAGADWEFGGVGDIRDPAEESKKWVQIWADGAPSPVRMSTPHLYTLESSFENDAMEFKKVEARVTSVLALFSALSGVEHDGRIAMIEASRNESDLNLGSVLTLTRSELGLSHDIPGEYLLPLHLAGYWWGGGVRVHGKQAKQLIAAASFVYAMHWLDHIGYAGVRDRVLDNIRAAADKTSRRMQRAPLSLSGLNLAQVSQYLWMSSQQFGIESWKRVVQRAWGRSTESNMLFAKLCMRDEA